MSTIELNNRKYTLITEIMRIDSETVLEKLIDEETLIKKSPLSFSLEELKHEIAEAEKETQFYNHEEVKTMSWKK